MSAKTIAFTSGCFDMTHDGHLDLFRHMRKIADITWVGLNSDAYIRRKKHRKPVDKWETRANKLYKTGLVDWVIWFDEDGPLDLIMKLRPNFIVVGNDYTMDQVVGAKESQEWGCQTIITPRIGVSTTAILQQMKEKEQTIS